MAEPSGNTDGKKGKDGWDKLDIVFKALISLTLAGAAVYGSIYLQNRQQTDAKVQIYAQLMSSREKSDSDLRKAMFDSVIQTFLNKGEGELDSRVLALELLTYNFHDVIDVGPLFKQVEAAIASESEKRRQLLEQRLEKVASEIIDRQLATLRQAGRVSEQDVFFEDLQASPGGITVLDQEYALPVVAGRPALKRRFVIQVLSADPTARQVNVRLQIWSVNAAPVPEPEEDRSFAVGFSDFPMIDNTRMANGDRVAISLRRWGKATAALTFAYFPGSRASLKDKLFYDEVLKEVIEES